MKFRIQTAILLLILSIGVSVLAQDTDMPAPRGYHHIAFDTESEQMVLFGGQLNQVEASPETWAFDVATSSWQHLEPEFAPPWVDTMTYYSPSDRIIGFAGGYFYGFASDPPAEVAQATWTYDLNTNTWTELDTNGRPDATIGARMVYDSESDVFILFGGLEMESVLELMAGGSAKMEVVNDTWAFDPNTNTWTRMNPPINPEGRNYHAMTYDPITDRVYLFSGWGIDSIGATVYHDDLWSYDYDTDTWEEIELHDDAPYPREYSAMVYDEAGQQFILFGGYNEIEDELFGDTWAFDPQTGEWSELSPDSAPDARGWHSMTYSDATEMIIMFGGGVSRDTFVNDVWSYDSVSNSWASSSADN